MRKLTFILFSSIFSLSVFAQEANWTQAEKCSADSLEQYIKGRTLYPNWIKGSHYFSYDVKSQDGNHHYLVNAENGKRKSMIKDNEQFVRQYAQITGDTLDAKDIQLYGYQFKNNDFSRFYLDKKGKSMVYDMNTGKLSEIPVEKKVTDRLNLKQSCHSADSLYSMLGSGYDLFVRDNRTGSVKRITFDGKEDASYTYRNSKDTVSTNSKGFWLGHRYIYMMQDMSEVKEISLIHSLGNSRPTTNTFKMPMPGDAGVRQYRVFWYDADRGQGKLLPVEKYPDQVVAMDYFRSLTALYITRRSRKADKIDLCRINVEDGTVTELISEECVPHINLTLFNYKILEQGKYFIWWSERTGKGNYYLYDHDGKLLNRITKGESLVAGNIVHVDTLKREMIFSGYGNEEGINPYYTFFYKARLDGKKQVLLTPGNGNHELTLSGDKKYAIDKYSRMDMFPVMNVLSIENPGKNFKVDQMDGSNLRQAGWHPPTLLKVKAADGQTDLYGLMYLPSHLDKSKKYPIISNVYPGPQDDQIPQSFVLDDNGNQSLAELGFIVINVAPRGSSPLRGHDFYCFSYGNLRDYPLADDKYVIEQLAKEYSYIDLDRVGIYGHSGGAFQTVASILTYPDFYKVAVAASGNHDNNIYIQWWGEIFHGLNEKIDAKTGKTTFSVKIPTNMELAGNLKGKLMLITGDVDKNVPPSSTYRLADALIKANKRFDMFILPGKDHGVMSPYYQNLIRYYFVENLLRPSQRHINIINHK
ncbi:S9 family peptidase [Bacteroides faecalis]|uniref:X-Pro dipeptidyl-peptidase n=1 Tax=Bacteroides faecalis TaxID=2447885 RepID=A0A401LP92_9BACE|nr:prolyl oligopeptidase family serine peptidase [Bacteroides faecalis]GCB33250.1 X-Pro dipeptidyl-peptidase [Bacteroides faecalis]GCB33313.1 X-Pro dipeptidyl-peptidase [Bacteroides faecalis]